MKIILPAIINPPRIRKDRSVSLSFDSRELSPEEMMTVLALSQSEGYVAFSPNQDDLPDAPKDHAEIDTKSPSTRLRNVLFVLYKKAVDEGKYIGLFDTYYKERVESIINKLKEKID